MATLRRVSFACPLCAALVRIVTLIAEVESGPPPIVTDLQGGCAHAAAFGRLAQALDETWPLIEAALDAADGEKR